MNRFKYWWLTHRPKRQLNAHKPRPDIDDVPWWNLILELVGNICSLVMHYTTPVVLVMIYLALKEIIALIS